MSKKLTPVRTTPAPFAEQLLAWFSTHARDLPWRKTRDLYRIWISEIMLQQTQVATVIGYYQRFLEAFPTVQRLAAADEEQVLRLWEGLGYYRRARQLHAAAKKIVAEHAGKFPQAFEDLRALPGIGRYTAGAILSIGLDQRLPILEANTVRLLSRLAGYETDPLSTAGQTFLWHLAEQILPTNNVGQFNQALMELGSLLCTPRQPLCAECPLAGVCVAKKKGLQAKIPLPKKKMAFESVTEAAVVIRDGERVHLRRRQPGERWAGLWDFVRFDVTDSDAIAKELVAVVRRKARQLTALSITRPAHLKTIKHGVTRFRITLHCFVADVSTPRNSSAKTAESSDSAWVSISELEAYPLSVTGRQIARLLAPPA